ncbi:hypothetical protein SRABI27_00236 [Pedobacter sp. Bi27]|nr:hypothetical protein SRABI126_00243 [Pedobacter sp. Bi126]CAH0139249.1 hypothetical protein SRABI27_00236 [Pedobacter sp. Bi27]CAH0219367.1 hypothetical protein SRABI36_02438 [Pedobacter sp. Bi36]
MVLPVILPWLSLEEMNKTKVGSMKDPALVLFWILINLN